MKNILIDVDNQFVDEYDTFLIYKKNIDEVLEQMGFDSFNTYNEFCKSIRNNLIDTIESNEISVMNKEIFSQAINRSLRDKIKEDVDYESKLMVSLGDTDVLSFMKKNGVSSIQIDDFFTKGPNEN